jgi:hypothetical protein
MGFWPWNTPIGVTLGDAEAEDLIVDEEAEWTEDILFEEGTNTRACSPFERVVGIWVFARGDAGGVCAVQRAAVHRAHQGAPLSNPITPRTWPIIYRDGISTYQVGNYSIMFVDAVLYNATCKFLQNSLPQLSWDLKLSVTLNQISHLQILKLLKRETTLCPLPYFLDILLEMFKSIQKA